jgi:(heptosyl)LPS beta-1,4-glucosyltransferase
VIDNTNSQSEPSKAAQGFAAAIVFLFPVLILVLRPADGLGLGLLALAGFWVAYQQRGSGQASREEKLLYFAVSFFFLVALLVTLLGGIEDGGVKKLGKFARLLLVIPVYVYLRRVGVSLVALWYGLAAGAVVAAGIALFDVWGKPPGFRARGITHPIIFGDLSLALAVMALAGFGWFRKRAGWEVLVPIGAVILGVVASFLSGSRGGWLAIPGLVLTFVWYVRHSISRNQMVALLLLPLVFMVTIYFVPQTGVQKRINFTIDQFSHYLGSDIDSLARATADGARYEMMSAAWQIFLRNPTAGIGWGHFKEGAKRLIAEGLRNKSAANWGHPHNQFLSALANGGVLAFIAILLLFLVPAKILIDVIGRKKTADGQYIALAGLLLIVAYMFFGLTEAILERVRPVSFFAFYLAVIFAAIHGQSRKAREDIPVRKQTLSVIVIAQDEADRIEPCLQSVANWADEIIVLDSGSSDNTVEIARRYTDKVYETDWPGYGPQKQRALEKAGCDWVLSIDADERVSPELRHDIDEVLSGEPGCVGYRTPWAVMVYGHRMDFGRSARSPMRLFQREGSRFTDAQVHEHVVLPKGQKGALEGRLYHYTHRNYGHALQKSAKYAWLGGQKRFAAGKWGGGLPIAALRSLWNFILIYFLRLGFLDGSVGFVVAVTYAQGAFNKYAALWTLRREKKLDSASG